MSDRKADAYYYYNHCVPRQQQTRTNKGPTPQSMNITAITLTLKSKPFYVKPTRAVLLHYPLQYFNKNLPLVKMVSRTYVV